MSATASVSKAATEIGGVFGASGRQSDLMIYALLLIILMLLVFLFLKEWLNQRKDAIAAAALKEASTAVSGLTIQVSRLESTNGQLLSLLLQERGKQ